MAKFSPSSLVSQVSGKVGGIVFSPSRNQQTIRNNSHVTVNRNINTSRIKAYTPSLISQFNLLSTDLKKAWVDRAAFFPVYDRFGKKLFLSGQNLFIKANINRLLGNQLLITSPPEVANYSAFPSYELIYSPGQIEFSFNANVPLVGDIVYYYATKPLSPGISNVDKSKYRYLGLQYIPTTNSFDITAFYNNKFAALGLPVGYKIFAYFFVQRRFVSSLPSPKYFASTVIT